MEKQLQERLIRWNFRCLMMADRLRVYLDGNVAGGLGGGNPAWM